jgi:hypothetical protein
MYDNHPFSKEDKSKPEVFAMMENQLHNYKPKEPKHSFINKITPSNFYRNYKEMIYRESKDIAKTLA